MQEYTDEDFDENWGEDCPVFTSPNPSVLLGNFAEKGESPSSIKNFLDCPAKWAIERHCGVELESEPSLAAFAGSIAHRVLELFYREPNSLRTKLTFSEIKDSVIEQAFSGEKGGYASSWSLDKDAEYFKKDGDYGFPIKFSEDLTNKANLFIHKKEKPKQVDIVRCEQSLRQDFKGMAVIKGKIDRIVEEDDQILIDDYKTGRLPSNLTVEDVTDLDFVAMMIYCFLVAQDPKKYGLEGKSIDGFRLLYTSHDTVIKYSPSKADYEKIERFLDNVLTEMEYMLRNNKFPLTPSETKNSGGCRFCPVKDYCPEWNPEKSFSELFVQATP